MEARIGAWLAAWVGRASARAAWVVGGIGVLTALLAAGTVGRLGINADENAMLSGELPHRIVELEYQEQFPVLYENILVVVDGPTPEAASQAARSLAESLNRSPDLFHSVYLPRGPFFDEHALLYMSTEELEDFGDRLARIQPYLSGLAEDGTLRGLAELMARGVRGAREGEVDGEVLFPVLERVRPALQARLENRSYEFSWAEVVAGRGLDADARQQFILVQPVLDFTDLAPARNSIRAIEQRVDELGLDGGTGFRVRMTGDVALAHEEMLLIEGQAARAGFASFVIVTAILFFALRSVRMVLSTVITLLVGLAWTAAFAAFAIGHLNLISVAFAVLYIGLAVDFGLHFCMRYLELRDTGRGHDEALRGSARSVGASLVLCALTTAIGFYAFAPTDFAGVAELGVIAGSGMFISLFLAFTLLPALLSLRLRSGETSPRARRSGALPSFPLRHPRLVGSLALGLAAAAALTLNEVEFEQNPLRVRDPSAQSVQVLEELLAKGTATPWELNAVAPDIESARALAERLERLDVVERALTVSDFIPGDQAAKLAIIEDVALFLPPLPDAEGRRPRPLFEEQLGALVELRDELDRWIAEKPDPRWIDGARGFRADLDRLIAVVDRADDGPARLDALETSLLGSLEAQLRTLDAALSPSQPITLERLPEGLLERMISSEGLVRVRIFPSQDIGEDAALAAFVNGVREVEPQISGGAINIYEASRAVVGAMRQAFTAAILVIALLLALIWRTLDDTALVMVPLAMAAVFTGSAAVLIGIPFNFADVIVLPLILGIGVDSGIHLVHRSHIMGADVDGGGAAGATHLLATSTARAVMFSALTTIASFGTLGFAGHRGLASLGQLLTLGVTLTLACNLVVLPAFIAWRERRRRGGRRPVGDALA